MQITNQGSGEDYARKVLHFLEGARKEKRREEKEEDEKTKWNMSAKVFSPAEKEETEKNAGRRGGETIELYPKGGLMVIHSEKCSDKASESKREDRYS